MPNQMETIKYTLSTASERNSRTNQPAPVWLSVYDEIRILCTSNGTVAGYGARQ